MINESRAEKVHRLKVAERERDNLLDAKVEAETYLTKEREIQRKKNALYQLHEQTISKNVSDYEQRHKDLSEKLTHEKTKLHALEQEIVNEKREYEKAKKEHDTVQKELSGFQTKYAACERLDLRITEDLKHASAGIIKQEEIVKKEGKREVEIMEELKKLSDQIVKYRTTLQDFQTKKVEEENELSRIMESLTSETAELRGELEVVNKRLNEEEGKVSHLQQEKDMIENDIAILKSRQLKASKKVEEMEKILETVLNDKRIAEERLREIERESAASTGASASSAVGASGVNASVSALQSRVSQLEQEERVLVEQLRQGRIDLENERALVEQNKQIQVQIEAIREQIRNPTSGTSASSTSASANPYVPRSVQAILQAAKPGGALAKAGVIGRLGDLSRIASTYDIAITTACSSLSSLVVRTAEGAQACAEFVRANRLDRTNFIILERVTRELGNKCKAPCAVPRGAERLFDLVSLHVTSQDLLPAFYHALKDTLVAQDLDQAKTIAYGDRGKVWRVVSLDGQLIESSGAMTGGGNSVRKGGMTLLDSSTANTVLTPAQRKVQLQEQERELIQSLNKGVSEERVRERDRIVSELQSSLSRCREERERESIQRNDNANDKRKRENPNDIHLLSKSLNTMKRNGQRTHGCNNIVSNPY